jgi:hypothetical protein
MPVALAVAEALLPVVFAALADLRLLPYLHQELLHLHLRLVVLFVFVVLAV